MSSKSLSRSNFPDALTAVNQRFAELSKQKAHLFSAPARINLIGEHTDYNLGWVLPAAIDRYIYFAIAPNDQDALLIEALDLDQRVHLPLQEPPLPDALWAKYFYGAVQVLKEKGYAVAPVTVVFGGTIPIGAGLSSSAALTCGFLFALSELYGWQLTRVEIAQFAQAAEHRVGLNCGIMDQYAVLHGKQNQVLQLDCLQLNHQYFPLDLGDYQLVLFNSMVSHALADSAYNDRRQSCELVLSTIQEKHPEVQSLRAVSFDLLEQFRSTLPPLAHQRVALSWQKINAYFKPPKH
ncbi:MAG: galactokinase family protein [Bacteroidota bacterium]